MRFFATCEWLPIRRVFFARGVRVFGAPGVAGMLGFEIFGVQRLRVRGFWGTEVRGGARGSSFSPLGVRGSRFWVGASKNQIKNRRSRNRRIVKNHDFPRGKASEPLNFDDFGSNEPFKNTMFPEEKHLKP